MDIVTEAERLAELEGYGILDTEPEPAFDDLVRVAAEALGCPTALVSLLDEHRQWFKARCSLDVEQTPRDVAFCEHVLRADAPLVVPDATLDVRFARNPLVTGPPAIRFYAGYPLRTPSGAVLGTLCVLGYEPRPAGLTPAQGRLMTVLAAQVMAQLELRRALADRDALILDLQAAAVEWEAAQEALRMSESRFRVLLDSNPVGQVELSPTGVVQHANAAFAELIGVPDPGLLLGRTADWMTSAEQVPDQSRVIEAAAAEPGQIIHTELTICRADGLPVEISGTLVGVAGPDGQASVLIASITDVSERNAAQRRLVELASELADAHDDALRRNALTDTVLATVGVGIVACDADGHLTLFNRATRDFHGMHPDPAADPGNLATTYALYEEDGTTLLEEGRIPLLRALRDGTVDGAVITIAPQGLATRVVRCDGRAMCAPDGRLLGAVVVMTDITTARRDARELAAQSEFTRVLLDTAHTAIWSCDVTGRPTYINATARDFLGWPDLPTLTALHEQGELASLQGGVAILHASGRPLAPQERPLARALAGETVGEVEVVLASAERPRRTLLLQASPLHDADGLVTGAMLTGHDVTDLRASEARFRAAFHDGPTPVARLDRTGVVREVNPALRRLTGLRSTALVGQSLARHVHPDDRGRLGLVIDGPGTGADPAEVRLVRSDQSAVWCELATTVSTGTDGQSTVLAQFLNVDARKAQEFALELAARHDPLTSLANRSQLTVLIQTALDAGPGLTAGVLFLDLDRFKTVNDEHGHDAGDAVLVEVATRLTAGVRPGDTVLRLGGDEFVVVCTLPVASPQGPLAALAARLEAALREPIPFRHKALHIGVSVGTAVAVPGQEPGALLDDADRSMYRRKHLDPSRRS